MATRVNALPCIVDYCDIDIRRCNASGTDDPKGTYVRIAKLQAHLKSPYNVNTHVSSVGIKLSTESAYKSIAKTTACGSGYTEPRPTLFTSPFSADQKYEFVIYVSVLSAYSKTICGFIQEYTLNSGRCLIDFSPSGAVSIGSFVSEGNGKRPDPRFEVGYNLKAFFLGGIEGVTNVDVGKAVPTGGKLGGYEIFRYVFEGSDPITDKSNLQIEQHEFNVQRVSSISMYGAAELEGGKVVPLPYFYSASEYIGVFIGPAGRLNISNHSGNTIQCFYVLYEYYDYFA